MVGIFVVLKVRFFSWRGLVLWQDEGEMVMRGNGGLGSLF